MLDFSKDGLMDELRLLWLSVLAILVTFIVDRKEIKLMRVNQSNFIIKMMVLSSQKQSLYIFNPFRLAVSK